MLLAINLLVRTMSPIQHAPQVDSLIEALVNQPILAVSVVVLLTWASHSSPAVVFASVSLVKSSVIAPEAALVLVLGANLGGTVPAFLETESPSARRLPLGNMLIRAVGVWSPCLPFI